MELSISNEFGVVTSQHTAPGGFILTNGKDGSEREDYTLRKTGPAPFSIGGNPLSVIGFGTLQISEGVFTIKGYGAFSGTGTKFKIDEGAIVSNRTDLVFSSIENNGTIVFTPNDATNKIQTSVFTGEGSVVVNAAGKRVAQLSFYSGAGRRYVIKSGRAMPYANSRHGTAYYAFNTDEEPLLNQRIDVEPGATFDMAGIIDLNASVTIAGTGSDGKGALVNTGSEINTGKSQIVQLTLADDASVGGVNQFGLLSPSHNEALIELGTHTLTIDTDARFFLSNVTLCGNGGFDIVRGTLYLLRDLRLADGASMDVRIGEDGVLDNDLQITVRNFENAGVVTNRAQQITVTGTVTGTGADHAIPKLALANGATIKISSADKPLVVSQTLGIDADATYTLDLAGFELTGEMAVLLVPPSGANLLGVKYNGVNLPNGTYVSVRGGVPSLSKSGAVIFIR